MAAVLQEGTVCTHHLHTRVAVELKQFLAAVRAVAQVACRSQPRHLDLSQWQHSVTGVVHQLLVG